MRYTVHAQWSGRSHAEMLCASVIEALSQASQLVAAGATGVYIYDDLRDQVYWPDHFPKLMPLDAAGKSGPVLSSGIYLSRMKAWLM
jgi:hypothetical protein